MHILMMSLYAAITAAVLSAIETKPQSMRDKLVHGLKVFGAFMGIGLALSWVLFPIPW
ncbi:MAG TPA: hypothetical protein VJX67_18955 [Blastocatellia bacterium]|nr:hypothetical protein [Blastocatellia bacterium]